MSWQRTITRILTGCTDMVAASRASHVCVQQSVPACCTPTPADDRGASQVFRRHALHGPPWYVATAKLPSGKTRMHSLAALFAACRRSRLTSSSAHNTSGTDVPALRRAPPRRPPRDLSIERCRRLRAVHAHRVQLLIPHLRSSELTVWLPHEESRAQHGTCNSQHPNSLKRDASVPSQPVQQSSPRLTSRQRILNEEGDSALGHQFRQTPKPDSGCSHAARADASAYAQSPNASPIPKSRPNAPLKARPHTTSR